MQQYCHFKVYNLTTVYRKLSQFTFPLKIVLHSLKKSWKIYLLYQEIQKRLRTILVYAEMLKYLVKQEAVMVIHDFAADPFKIFPFFCDILITRSSFCSPFNHPHSHSTNTRKRTSYDLGWCILLHYRYLLKFIKYGHAFIMKRVCAWYKNQEGNIIYRTGVYVCYVVLVHILQQ